MSLDLLFISAHQPIAIWWRCLKATRGDEKSDKVVRKAMVQQSPYSRQRHYKSGGSNKFRGRGQRTQIQRQGLTQRPFLGKRPSSYGNPYQKPQKGGGKSKETKP